MFVGIILLISILLICSRDKFKYVRLQFGIINEPKLYEDKSVRLEFNGQTFQISRAASFSFRQNLAIFFIFSNFVTSGSLLFVFSLDQ